MYTSICPSMMYILNSRHIGVAKMHRLNPQWIGRGTKCCIVWKNHHKVT